VANNSCDGHVGLDVAAGILTLGIGGVIAASADSKAIESCSVKRGNAKNLDARISRDLEQVERLKPTSNYALN
jgi:hypothetical protein